jgi:Bifunctional DNA primase/polymerase, N-terminal/Protein of unknown function (DUF3987)
MQNISLFNPFQVTNDPFAHYAEEAMFAAGCCGGYENIPLDEWIAPPANDNSCLDAALRYASENGWYVFAADIADGEKKGHKAGISKRKRRWDATRDPKQIWRDFTQWPEAVGIETGVDSGIFVVETDTLKAHKYDGGANLRMLEAEHSRLPETRMAVSPSGSMHRYFKHPGGEIVSRTIVPGVDCKGDAGMVIAPPSVRKDGVYRWFNDLPIADAPDWLIKMVQDDVPEQSNSNSDNPFTQHADEQRFEAPIERIEQALAVIPLTSPDAKLSDRDYRVTIGHAVKRATGGDPEGAALFCNWRMRADDCDVDKVMKQYVGFNLKRSSGKRNGFGTLKHYADEASPNWESRQPASTPQVETWPTLHPDALYGLAGKVVALFDPHTESDPVALLLQFFVCFGNALGRGPYFLIEGTKHYTNIFTVLCGETGKSRKGTSGDRIRQLMTGVAFPWVDDCIQSGLSSGEGLIWVIRDEVIKKDKEGNDVVAVEGVDDKRLLLDEREFFQCLTVMKRDGNTVSRIVRDGWDGRDRIKSLTKNSPAQVTKPHISVIGHITVDELRRMLDVVSMVNGYANRFLFACVRRSKFLPFGGSLEQPAINTLAREINKVFEKWWLTENQITMDDEARALYANVYRQLSEGQPGLIGAITGRGDAQTIRLALLYALLDGSEQIRLVHLRAALALWKYCEDSARYIFGDAIGDPLTDDLLRALRSSGQMTRTEIRDLFKRNKDSGKIDAALATLKKYGRVRSEMRSTGSRGPKVEVWSLAK